jgi:ABC-type nitrate/sulfonate/bicarbonate transport system permease component
MATVATPTPITPKGLPGWVKSPTFARILFPFVVLGIWYFIYYTLDSRIFPSPQQVAVFMWEEITLTSGVRYSSVAENIYVQFGITLMRLTIGFFIALVLGTIIGLAMGISKKVDAFFHDWVMGVLAMPALVYALFLGLALGFTSRGPILAVVIAGAPFVIINIREGVRNTPRELIDMATSFDVPQNKITRHVLLPSLMPFFFAAIRYAYAVGWKGLVITEVFASDRGMGWTIKFWYDAHRAHGVIGYALFFIIFALALEKLVFDPLADRAFKWRPKIDAVQMAEGDMAAVASEGVLLLENQEVEDGVSMTNVDGGRDG